MKRKTLLTQQHADAVVAESKAGHLGEVRREPTGRPSGESVAQRQRVGRRGFLHGRKEVGSCLRVTTRRLDRIEGFDATQAIEFADALDRLHTASQVPRDRSHRVSRIGQENDQAIAEDIRRGRR
jgi:hypothetical protein